MDSGWMEKEILHQVLQEMNQYTKLQCEHLEKQFESEIQNGAQDMTLYTGVTERKYYDITDGSMFPMCREDLKEKAIGAENLLGLYNLPGSQKEGTPVKAADIFLELGSREIKLLLEKKQTFSGNIYTLNGPYPVTAVVRQSQRYQKVLKQFYQIVFNQGIPVPTVCAPYLDKFLEVCLTDAKIPPSEKIDRIEIDFKEYEPYIKYHCFPVWNIEESTAVSSVRTVGNLDRIAYKHLIPESCLKDGRYLVADETDLLGVNREDEGLVITTEDPREREWRLWRVVPKVSKPFHYPVFHNKRTEGKTNAVRTKQGVIQLVNSLLYQERLLLSGIQFPAPHSLKRPVINADGTYLNPQDIGKGRRPMLLSFRKQTEDFLQTDVLTYLIRAVQHSYPEFCCYGRFEEKEDFEAGRD